ncbi:MAG: Lipoprotein-releasing system ATP-binding protein LolD [Gammaproteobacteria bacterium]|nr:Lipoprotein-releasing system ATP-binding protein LolD [Gammaproteobacteria bacterium]
MKVNERPIVRAEGLVKQVDGPSGPLTIVNDVSLQVFSSESVAIIGVSGSGKSTLLALLAGLDIATEGIVWLNGQCLDALDEDGRALIRARQVGFVFQSFQLLPGLSALENVLLPLELAGRDRADDRAREFLDDVGLLNRAGHYPSQLSGGEQQRVAIARAFAVEPSILFADEPTGNLDNETGGRVADLLFRLNREKGTTLILVTHDPALGGRCTRAMSISDGRLSEIEG